MRTCLLVDEAPIIRKVAARILLQYDMDVEAASSTREAREWIDANGLPDIVIVGASTATSDGPDFVKDIANRPGGASTIILATIVEANLGLMTRLKRAGARDFILKPFNRETLKSRLDPHLRPVAVT